MRKSFLLWLVMILVFTLSGCGNKDVENAANEAAAVFSSGNMEEINRLIFDTQELATDTEIAEFFGNEDENDAQEVILNSIFSHSAVSVKKVDESTIEFEIISPNMENVFKNLPDLGSEFTEMDLVEYIEEYANNAETKSFTVAVPYTVENETVVIDYRDESFINAITGGLVDAYKQLYADALNPYQEGVN